jgi:hypothetical protein
LTGNYLWSGIDKGFSTPAKTTWVYDPLNGSAAETVHTTDEPYKYTGNNSLLFDYIFNRRPGGFPDGEYSITAKFGDKPQLRNTLRVSTKKGC